MTNVFDHQIRSFEDTSKKPTRSMPPCGGCSLPSLHLLSLHENTGVKVEDYLSAWLHPDPRVRDLAENKAWDSRDACSICHTALVKPSPFYAGEEENQGAVEVEVLVENPACKHVFHRACLQRSIQAGNLTCPECRAVIKQSVINELAPGMGFTELANSDAQTVQRTEEEEDFYGEARNLAMDAQLVDPADQVDNLAPNEVKNELLQLESTISALSTRSVPPVLRYGIGAVKALLTLSSVLERKKTMEKLRVWHHANVLLRSYKQVHLWPSRTRNRDSTNQALFTFFDSSMLFLRMDLPELRKVLIYVRPDDANTDIFKLGEKEFTGLPGLDQAIELIADHNRLQMYYDTPLLSDEQVKALEYYISDCRLWSEYPKPGEGDGEVENDGFEFMFFEVALLEVAEMLEGFNVFLPGLEQRNLDLIWLDLTRVEQGLETIRVELVQLFPEAQRIMDSAV